MWILIVSVGLVIGCAAPTLTPSPSPTFTLAPTVTVTPRTAIRLSTPSNNATYTPTSTFVPTATRTPTLTSVPTPTRTPTRTATPWPPPRGSSECNVREFYSEALGHSIRLFLYLPIGYYNQNPRRYPTVYLLSGIGGSHLEWPTYGVCQVMDELTLAGRVQPMIVVMPSGNDNPAGGIGSYWVNHAPPPMSDGKRWGDYIWRDLVRYIDSNYRTIPYRNSRAIGGLSAGGQGALTHALTHPEVFGVVGAHSPSFRRADGSIPALGDPTFYNQYDPIWLVQNTRAAEQLQIWIDDGDADTQWGTAIREFRELLVARNIPHEWHVFPGGHEPSYWMSLVPTYLQWYSSKLIGQ
ncbi:MAG: esterase family protein [Anaerolineae bacterium]|nr:esterase family protein [Anaerolineae bacterium]